MRGLSTYHVSYITHTLKVLVFVTTSLSANGSFWAQLSLEDPSYDKLAEELKKKLSETKDIMTPVFFNIGDLCAGLFSEDESWYRARIIGASGGSVGLIGLLSVWCRVGYWSVVMLPCLTIHHCLIPFKFLVYCEVPGF